MADMSVYDMSRDEFLAALGEKTTPQHIFDHAPGIYEELGKLFNENCGDSVLREWAFEWSSARLGCHYNDIYDKWLGPVEPYVSHALCDHAYGICMPS